MAESQTHLERERIQGLPKAKNLAVAEVSEPEPATEQDAGGWEEAAKSKAEAKAIEETIEDPPTTEMAEG